MILNDFLKENEKYFNQNFNVSSDEIMLFESFYSNKNLIYGITKVCLTLSLILNLKPLCILPPATKNHNFIKSLCGNTINSRSLLLKSIFKNFIFLTTIFFTINKIKLLNLTINGVNIGKYIYDAILIRHKIISIDKINFKFRLNIVFEVAFYFCFKQLFLKYNVKYLVLGDNTYRHGMLLELSKKFNVKCITPLDLNAFQLSKYNSTKDYEEHCYAIKSQYLEKIKNKKEAIRIANDYLDKRFSGSLDQHDVLNAFKNKKIKTKEQFCNEYNLDQRKKIVAIIPHIFCDACHAYPQTLYSDYYEWFVETAKILSQNKYINIIVKEHPSAHLYNEQGKLDQILKKFNFNIIRIDPNENQYSLIQNSDMVVSCGGTIGLEFSCIGKPVFLAAKPPYSNLGFTIDSESKEDYKKNLLNCHLKGNLNIVQKENALLTAYLTFCKNDINIDKLEIGSQKVSFGKTYKKDILFNEISNYQKIKISDQYIYSCLNDFINNPNRLGLKF